jgi:16S rRNA (cytosine967-C5)-methyltransferase
MSLATRKSALSILVNIEENRQTLDRLMDAFHSRNDFDRRDEAFVRALVYGVLRWRGRLDWMITAVSSKPLSKMDPDIRNIVRMGLFQIVFMDRVPKSAAVNTSVELAKSGNKRWLAGFVNAVLRNALRRSSEIALLSDDQDPVRSIAVRYSMPEWLVSRWIRQLGENETVGLCKACNRIPPLALRTNTLNSDRAGIINALKPFSGSIRASEHTPEGVLIDGLKERLFDSPPFRKGWFQAQDEAAQAVSHLVAPKPGDMLLDACAGLGGKTTHMAALMGNTGHITAMDREGRKLQKLKEETIRLGIAIVHTQTVDLEKDDLTRFRDRFDRILLDAPCSGLGVIRRNPDTKWSRTPQDIARCARRQSRLLHKTAPLVKPGGKLVYAVCSTEPEETISCIDSFLNKRSDFVIDDSRTGIPPSIAQLLDRQHRLVAFPHRHGTDGFFAVRLRRRKDH